MKVMKVMGVMKVMKVMKVMVLSSFIWFWFLLLPSFVSLYVSFLLLLLITEYLTTPLLQSLPSSPVVPLPLPSCCLARRSLVSPRCWCRCLLALQTSSTWCCVTPTGGVLMFGAGCR